MLGSLLPTFLSTTCTPPPCLPLFSQTNAKCQPKQKHLRSGRAVTCHTLSMSPLFSSLGPPQPLCPLFHQTYSVQNLWRWRPCLKGPSLAMSAPHSHRHAEGRAWVVRGNPSFKCMVLFFPLTLTCPANSSSSTSQTHFPDYTHYPEGELKTPKIRSYKRARTIVTTYPDFLGKSVPFPDHASWFLVKKTP